MAGVSPSTKKPQRALEERALDRARQQVLRRWYRVVRAARELVAEGGLDAVTLRALLRGPGSRGGPSTDTSRAWTTFCWRSSRTRWQPAPRAFESSSPGSTTRFMALEQAVRTIALGALFRSERNRHARNDLGAHTARREPALGVKRGARAHEQAHRRPAT